MDNIRVDNFRFKSVDSRYKLFLLLILMVLQCFDVLTTYYGLYHLDHIELNPLFNFLINTFGFWSASLFKLSVMFIFAVPLLVASFTLPVKVAIVATFIIVIVNIVGILYTFGML